jgi:uncharacterized Zn finger protein (UPF0148 family)
MTTLSQCPSCGAPIEPNFTGTTCPSCGTALPLPNRASSAPTIVSSKSSFNSSAEVMDEVKKLASEGDTKGAEQVAAQEFDLNQVSAEETVEQVKFNLRESNRMASTPEPAPSYSSSRPQVIDAPGYAAPKQPANNRNRIMIGSIAAAVVLLCCCCLPLIVWLFRMRGN